MCAMTQDLYERYKEALRSGHVAVLRGSLEEALQMYTLASEIAPSRALPHTSLGGVYMRLNRLEEALTEYAAAVARSPRDEGALLGQADALATVGRPRDAAVALDHVAEIQEASARLPEAADTLRRALELEEAPERVHRQRALLREIRLSAGDRAAEQLLARALRLRDEPDGQKPVSRSTRTAAAGRGAPEPEPAVEPAPVAEPAPVVEIAAEALPVLDSPDAGPVVEAESEPEPIVETEPELAAVADAEPMTEPEMEPTVELEPEPVAASAERDPEWVELDSGSAADEGEPIVVLDAVAEFADEPDLEPALGAAAELAGESEVVELSVEASADEPSLLPEEPRAVGVMAGVDDLVPEASAEPATLQPSGDELLAAAEAAEEAGDDSSLRSLLLWTARAYAREGRFEAGLDTAHRLLMRSPSDVDAHLVLVELYVARNWDALAAEKLLLLGRLAELDNDDATRRRLCQAASRAFPGNERLEALCS
jgi:tetratricopeptide (TPR) repeat protein